MKRLLMFAGIQIVSVVLVILVVEGSAILVRWKHSDNSLIYKVYATLQSKIGSASGQSGVPIASRADIEALIPDMIADGVGMGNVPYKELVTGRAAINEVGPDGCRSPRPNISKTAMYIRSGDFDRFDPPSIFHDSDAKLNGRIQDFIDTYSVGQARFSSNSFGERVTLPEVSAAKKILVAGGSVAAGAMIDDSETIASQLQRTDLTVQYVNLGVNGALAADFVCSLAKAAERYKGEIGGLIYIYSEKDFDPSGPYGKSEEIIGWLKELAEKENIPEVTIIFASYIYNIIPHLSRFSGSRGARHGVYAEETRQLKDQVAAAGFKYVSIPDVALAEAKRRRTDFAVFALFVDHSHLSDYGVSLLVEALQ